MIEIFATYVWAAIKASVPASILLIIIILILTIWMAVKIDRALHKSTEDTDFFKKKLEIEEKQRLKIETLVADLPCVSKENATWLQNVNKNGGACPGKNVCKYEEQLLDTERD